MSEISVEHRLLQWDSLGKLANGEISKVVAAIPIIGYLPLYNDHFAEALSFDSFVGNTDTEPSKFVLEGLAKLRLTFFRSILILVANLVFRAYRPACLLHSSNEIEFASKVDGFFSMSVIHQMEKDIWGGNWVRRTSFLENERYSKLATNPEFTYKMNPNLKRDQIQPTFGFYVPEIAREWWTGQMHTYKPARHIVFFVSCLGFAMIAIPSVDILQAVIRDLAQTLFI